MSKNVDNHAHPEPSHVWLLDDTGTTRESFDVGETIYLAAQGLRPTTLYEIVLQSRARDEQLVAHLITDRYGSLPITALLPYFGLSRHGLVEEDRGDTHDEAEHKIGGRTFTIRVRPVKGREVEVTTTRFVIAKRATKPQVVPSDLHGRLQTGILQGGADVVVALRKFPRGCVRVILVPRQFDWQPGDPIEPVQDAHGAPIVVTTSIGHDGNAIVPLWPRERVRPGSYQFIARAYLPGWYKVDDMVLLPDDIVSSRRISSLVVRLPVNLVGFADDGTILTPELAGRRVIDQWAAPPSPSFTGFDIYDEAGKPRSFVFVYGATHDRFNSEWASIETTTELAWGNITSTDLPKLISQTAHQDVVKGYGTAYYQLHLQGKSEQIEYFTGVLKPSLASAIQIHNSHQEPGSRIVDNFQQLPHDATVNSLGGNVTTSALLAPPVENDLHTLDSFSPHQTAGEDIAWNSSAGIYISTIPAIDKDISGFTTLSFRVTQKYGSAQNLANQPQELYVRLTDGNGNSRAIRTGVFTDIPYPYERGVTSLIKSALKTVRIPLLAYTIANLGAANVNLANIQSVTFSFAAKPTGEIEIDDIELSN